ncbi:MAG: hypothetical protein ACT4N9_04985 [Paracoccaceae bacterium]
MSLADDLAARLARDVVDALDVLGDDRFYDKVSKVLLETSPTMQDAFNTAIKVILAERKGREFLQRSLAARGAGAAPKVPPGGGH